MKHLISCVAVPLALVPAAVWSDCVDGTRSASSEERTFARQLSESLKAALPAAPAPLYLEREPELIMGTVCKDTPANEVGGLVMANYTEKAILANKVALFLPNNDAQEALPLFTINGVAITVDGGDIEDGAQIR